jgi:hypothetical protein
MSEEKKRVEDLLKEFSPRPAPPGLKKRLIAAAGAAAASERFLSAGQRKLAAALGLLIVAAVGGDAWLGGRAERAALVFLAGSTGAGTQAPAIDRDFVAEIAGRDANLEKLILERLKAGAEGRAARPRAVSVGAEIMREVDDVL